MSNSYKCKDMFTKIVIGVLLCLLQFGGVKGQGLTCLKCDRVRQPYDCVNVVRCGKYELCHVRKYLSYDRHEWFDIGCRDYRQCAGAPALGKRDTVMENNATEISLQSRFLAGDKLECEQCCNTQICNSGTICGAHTLQHTGLICFKCSSTDHPDACNTVTMCSKDELCFLQSTKPGLSPDIVWQSGCERKDACQQLSHTHGSLNQSCCSSDLCNADHHVTTAPMCPKGCPSGWHEFSGHCYYFSRDYKQWAYARRQCLRYQSHMVKIETDAENDWLQKRLGTAHSTWIGAKEVSENNWIWSADSSPVTKFHWGYSEPNGKTTIDCIHFNYHKRGGWIDTYCTWSAYYICEKPC